MLERRLEAKANTRGDRSRSCHQLLCVEIEPGNINRLCQNAGLSPGVDAPSHPGAFDQKGAHVPGSFA